MQEANSSINLSVGALVAKINLNFNIELSKLRAFKTKGRHDFTININKNNKSKSITQNTSDLILNPITITSQNGLKFVSNIFTGEYLNSNFDFEIPNNLSSNYFLIRETIRLSYAIKMLEKNFLLIHSSGIVRNNRVFLFVGLPGSGKTTIGKMAVKEGFKTLNDEYNIISNKLVYSTPFGGDLPASIELGKIKKLFFLAQSNNLRILKKPLLTSVPELMQNEFLSMSAALPIGIKKQIFMILFDYLKNIECYDLYFPRKFNLINILK